MFIPICYPYVCQSLTSLLKVATLRHCYVRSVLRTSHRRSAERNSEGPTE